MDPDSPEVGTSEYDLKRSAPLGVDGQTLTVSHDQLLKDFFKGEVHCRWCLKQLHADSYQFIGFNGGILTTLPYPTYPNSPYASVWDPLIDADNTPLPHVYCGCTDACLAKDMANGVYHLEQLGVI